MAVRQTQPGSKRGGALRAGLRAIAFLAPLGMIIAGIILVITNRCFFAQFPPSGCPVASIRPRGTSLGYELIFGGIGLLAVLGVVGAAMSARRHQK